MYRIPVALIAVFCILSPAGCSKQSRLKISGTVKYRNQPLDQGRIEFEGTEPGVTLYSTAAPIENGSFTISPDSGLTPGKYKVRIYSSDRVMPTHQGPPPAPGTTGMPPPKERIAAKYNTDTTLIAEVKPDTDNVFEFAVD